MVDTNVDQVENSSIKDTNLENDCIIDEYENKDSVLLLKDDTKLTADANNLFNQNIQNEVFNEGNGELIVEEMKNNFINSEIQNNVHIKEILNIDNIEILNSEAYAINNSECLDKDKNDESTKIECELKFNSIDENDVKINELIIGTNLEDLNLELNNMSKATEVNDILNFDNSINIDESIEVKKNIDENDNFNNEEKLILYEKTLDIEYFDNNENLLPNSKEYEEVQNLGKDNINSITEEISRTPDDELSVEEQNYLSETVVNSSNYNNRESPDLKKENFLNTVEIFNENQLNFDKVKANEENVNETTEMDCAGIIIVDSKQNEESKVLNEDNLMDSNNTDNNTDLKVEVGQLEIQSNNDLLNQNIEVKINMNENDNFDNMEKLICDEKTLDIVNLDNVENLEKDNINSITEKICETPDDSFAVDEQEYLSETLKNSDHNYPESPDLKDKENQLKFDTVKANEENVNETIEMNVTDKIKVDSQQNLESKVLCKEDNIDMKVEVGQLE